ncbi:MAG: serine/threonine-protein kinase PknG [Actinomycetota bacterium]|nr:serine/threonine-protein kinase PknG [Actinomycetota bacterium]
MSCERPGCTGQIEEGFCNLCGMAPVAVPASGRTGAAPPGRAGTTGAPAATTGSAVSSRGTGTSGSRGTHRRTTSVSSGTRGSLGAGLVDVPPVPYRDPATVVMANPEVPERKRFCGSCAKEVGRGRGGKQGRPEGFCPHCGQPFSFAPKLHPGTTVAGQYRVVGCLAFGGLGWIYLAQDRNVSDRWVVLKGLLDSGDPSAMAAAIVERRFLAQVEHPNIVRIYNFVTHAGAGYIVMEYVGGQSLKELRQAHHDQTGQALPLAQAIAYILECLPALGYLHSRDLLYCDFKPDNVIQSEEQLRLIDLGGVRGIDDDDSDLYGTVGYQAPEVPEAGASVSSDLYTVARTLAVLTFDFRGFADPGRFAASVPPADQVEVLARYQAFERFLRKATHLDPDARFETAGEMADQLVGVLCQVIAIDGGRPRATPSRMFTAELLTDPTGPAWRDLPAPRVDATDGAAGLLAGLAAAPPEQLVAALKVATPTTETRFQLARAHIEQGEFDEAERLLVALRADDEADWRADWWEGVLALAAGRPQDATTRFTAAATELPGELAPVLALGFAAEQTASDPLGAAPAYSLVAATDPGYAGAAFGLSRVRLAIGDRSAAAAAVAAVPSSSAFFAAAQATRVRMLLSPLGDQPPGSDDVNAAAGVLEVLTTDNATRLALTRDLLAAALPLVTTGVMGPAATATLGGAPRTETGIRTALERTLRALARLAATDAERIELVDQANAARPRTLT